MKKTLLASILITTGLLGGCATMAPSQTTLTSTYNADDIAWAAVEGNNSIHGDAFLRQRGGGVVTCAGQVVNLYPVAEYSAERITAFYGNTDKGYRPASMRQNLPTAPAEYYDVATSYCDAQGKFEFTDIADGSYFLATTVTWIVPGQYVSSTQGGNLMQRVTVEGGDNLRVAITY